MITFNDLLKAASTGGASILSSVTELEPAAGKHASVAPAKFISGNKPVFAFETRYIDGEPVRVGILDSKQSQLNRAEAAIMQDIHAGHKLLSKLPRIEVTYDEKNVFTDLELPHRFTDGHIRAGKIDDVPTTAHELYRAMRNATPADLSAILNNAPAAALFGAWDSTRKSNQVRLRSALVGEIIGVLADQEKTGEDQQSQRGGARVDPIAMSVHLEKSKMEEIIETQKSELSAKTIEKLHNEIKKGKKDATLSASSLGLGGIPPKLEALGGIACNKIIRSWVLSFATLRQIRFGGPDEVNIAGRALLAALGLVAISRAEQELYLRANCDLVEAGKPIVTLDQRYGKKREEEPITVENADKLLEEAIEHARAVGVARWEGQILHVIGNPAILSGALESEEEE